ncbi:MltR family transcriptional regulator [Vibrio sp. VB16]|uniref:MltR family transcriptional regulator n=1 Tax=Vibrio sp. VB16 TaxID=2785746 RepID=UPI00189D7931|nr:MltR family transcriptional regulator [Vibrio sp. VB16]UGA57020.1 MltR family transcriptional regulator [Vibrio sp. VB16]
MPDKVDETEVIEKLNSTTSVRAFIVVAVSIFNEAVEGLMHRIFQKDNFAVQSVVGPLLHDTGPLGDVSVRLKLLFGLGVIPDAVYHDIEDIIKLQHKLNADLSDHEFTTPAILEAIQKLRLIQKMGTVQFTVLEPEVDGDLEFYQLQQLRQQQVIKSSLALAVVEICHELNKESPF